MTYFQPQKTSQIASLSSFTAERNAERQYTHYRIITQ